MDAQSLSMGGADVGAVPASPSAMEILARQRQQSGLQRELAQGQQAQQAAGGAPSPENKQQKKAEKKLEKLGVRTKFSFQIPMDLGLDRRMTVTGPATMDEHGAGVQFDAIVPPGGQSGQVWHFKVQPDEPGELWTVTETIKFVDPPDAHAMPGAGKVYECVSRAVLRAGLDTYSKQVGFCERGEQYVCLESRLHAGRTRVRFEGGWTSVRSGSGRRLLRKIDGLAPWLEAEREAKERTVSWLELQGYPPNVIERICDLFLEAGYKPTAWLDRLGDVSTQAITATTFQGTSLTDCLCVSDAEAGASGHGRRGESTAGERGRAGELYGRGGASPSGR